MAERQLGYEIELITYAGNSFRHFIHARNEMDAFDKAHHFMNPEMNVQFIIPRRIKKADAEKRGIKWED